MPERCDTCRLWRRLTADAGTCHALAPQPVLYDLGALLAQLPAGGIRVAWPVTLASQFCGEWSPLPVRPQRPDRPRKVCLCGSTRFKQAFIEANFRETMAGRIVLSVGWFSHADAEVYAPTEAEKQALDELHLRKIDEADEVLVLNVLSPRCPVCKAWCKVTRTHVGTMVERACGCPTGVPVTERTPVELHPYVGESTRREVAYAEAAGKPVRYLEPPREGETP